MQACDVKVFASISDGLQTPVKNPIRRLLGTWTLGLAALCGCVAQHRRFVLA